MGIDLLDISMVKLSILILFILCLVLIGLVFALAISFWRFRDKLKEEKFKLAKNPANKHHLTGLDNRASLIDTLKKLVTSSKEQPVNIAMMLMTLIVSMVHWALN